LATPKHPRAKFGYAVFPSYSAYRGFCGCEITPYELPDYPYVTSRFHREKWQICCLPEQVEWLRELAEVQNAVRSTLTALFYDLGARPRLGAVLAVLAFLPICAGLQAIAPRSPEPKPAMLAIETRETAQLSSLLRSSRPAVQTLQPAMLSPAAGKLAPLISVFDAAQAKPFFFVGSVSDRDNAITCLAAAAWYEAGNDPEAQRSVIQVVLNRLKHPNFPKTICGVVLQGAQRSTGCQFTFTCDGSLVHRRPSSAAWNMARLRAQAALDGSIDTNVMQATHYHADYVAPWWSQHLEKLAKVGRHIFYRWPGVEGRLTGKPSIGEGVPQTLLLSLANDMMPTQQAGGKRGVAGSPASPPTLQYAIPPASRELAAPSVGGEPFGTVIVMAVDNSRPSGRWAVEALARCSGLLSCQIFAYADARAADRNAALPEQRRDRPDFMLIRDKSSGMTLALWDCEKNARPSNSQCLPSDINHLIEKNSD